MLPSLREAIVLQRYENYSNSANFQGNRTWGVTVGWRVLFWFGQENGRDSRVGVVYGVWTGEQEGQQGWRVLLGLDRRTVETGDLAWFYLGLDKRTGGTGGVYGAFVRVASLGVPNRHAL